MLFINWQQIKHLMYTNFRFVFITERKIKAISSEVAVSQWFDLGSFACGKMSILWILRRAYFTRRSGKLGVDTHTSGKIYKSHNIW